MFKNSVILLILLSSSSYAFTLKEGFIKTLNNDPEVQVREIELKKIKYDIDIANGLMYPSLYLQGALTNTRESIDSSSKRGELISEDEYSLKLNQPLYDGFESKYEKQLQKNRYESAQYYLKEAENALALNYIQNYFNVLKIKEVMSLSNESYKMSQDIFDKTTKKVKLGYGTKLEFERSKANLEESSVNLSIDQLSFNDAIQSLYKNVQEEFDSNKLIKPTFTYNIPSSKEEALKYALSNHPSMKVSLKNVDVVVAEQKRNLKSFHPDVNLIGSYRLDDVEHKEITNDTSNEYQVGIELSYNLYNGGKDAAQNQKSLQTIKERRVLVEKSDQEISIRLGLAWNSYKLNAEKLARLQAFVKTRHLVLNTTLKEFDLGTKNLGNVVDAHLDYISTRRTMILTKYDLLTAHYRVLEAIGILSDEIQK